MLQYGLVGYPLTHSFSKKYFTEKFHTENISADYLNFETDDITGIKTIIENHPSLKGLNITIPYKEQIIKFIDELHPEAAQVGAVNTLLIKRVSTNYHTIGYNTDIYGFSQSLKPLLKSNHYKALILGNGGAAKAVKYVLRQLGIEVFTVSRSGTTDFTYKDLNKYTIENIPLIINTTPLGMYPHIDLYPQIPFEFIGEKHLCYDLIYNPQETLFLQKAKARGALISNGYNMLILQAEKAWEIWNEKH
jgi:shikimate dehydrogenase